MARHILVGTGLGQIQSDSGCDYGCSGRGSGGDCVKFSKPGHFAEVVSFWVCGYGGRDDKYGGGGAGNWYVGDRSEMHVLLDRATVVIFQVHMSVLVEVLDE
ncbi:hypothetical protein AgCh_014363 [Apium graveolens]